MGVVVFAKVQGLAKSESPRLCMLEDLFKNYYSHLYFVVVIFLEKNSKMVLYYKKILSKHNFQKNFDDKFYYCPRILKNLEDIMFSFPLFFLTIFEFLSGRDIVI